MALQFNPPPYRDTNKEIGELWGNTFSNLGQSVTQMAQQKKEQQRQNMLMEYMKQEEARKQQEQAWKGQQQATEYGVQAPSSESFPISGPMTFDQSLRSTLDPSSPASPATAVSQGGMVEKFRQWQDQNRGGPRNQPMGMPRAEVGYKEVLPEVPGYTPDMVRAMGGTGYSTMGTKRMEEMQKVWPNQNTTTTPLFYKTDLTKNRPTVLPKGAQIVDDTPRIGADTASISWGQATPQERRIAIGVYNGTIRPGDIGYRERTKAVYLANEYANANGLEPLRSYAGEVSGKTATAFATGKQGQNVNALNTALGHLDSLHSAFQDVGNTNQAWMNVPINKLRKMTNDPAVIRLDATLNAVQGEAANVFKGSGATDQEINSWRQVFNRNLTPAQAVGVIQQTGTLFQSRLDALQYQRDSNMGGGSNRGSLLSPHGSQLMKKFEQGGGQGEMIRVRNKQTGQTGQLPASSFDPSRYDQL